MCQEAHLLSGLGWDAGFSEILSTKFEILNKS